MTTRVLIYTRYSSALQDPRSCADQARNCHAVVALRPEWRVVLECADQERSGYGDGALRPGFRQMLDAVKAGRIDVVLVDDLSRLSRDIAEPFVFFRELQFRKVRLMTVADGEINVMTLTMRSAMNSQYLDALKHQTRRGMRGVVESGRSGGGCPYGYVPDRTKVTTTRHGLAEPERGHLTIDPAQAAIVRRVFHEFGLLGMSPQAIVRRLNAEGIPSPSAHYRRTRPRVTPWSPSTLRGGFAKQNGILRNRLYVGERVWNRLEYRVNPSIGRRVGFVRDATEVVTISVPDLRIVDDGVWQAAQTRLAAMRAASLVGARPERAKRPQYLLSGLAKCDLCGGSFVLKVRNEMRCHHNVVTRTCRNRRVLKREALEARVLTALRTSLLASGGPFDAFCAEVTAERARRRSTHDTDREQAARALANVEGQIQHFVRAIGRGVEFPEMTAEMAALQRQKAALLAQLADAPAPPDAPPLDVVSLRAAFRAAVAHLASRLDGADEVIKAEARDLLRGVIERIEVPADADGPVWVVGKVEGVVRAAGGSAREAAGVAIDGCGGANPALATPARLRVAA